MRQYVTSVCVFTATLIALISICVLSCSAKMTGYLLKRQDFVIKERGSDGLIQSEIKVSEDFNERVSKASIEAFSKITEIIYDEGVNISEEEANDIYKRIVLQLVKNEYGLTGGSKVNSGDGLDNAIENSFAKVKIGEIKLSDDKKPYFKLENSDISINDIFVEFTYGNVYKDQTNFDVSAHLSEIMLYDENKELFNYAMVAGKGIYITGKTSTVIGDIYTGTHGPAELRKAEALYGESDSFGGLNIMSTQVAIDADKIVTDGNVSMRGAFVVFGSDERPIVIKARGINEVEDVLSKNIYALVGELSDEGISAEKAMYDEATRYLGSIEHYYDSDNDKSYTGKYRKIISSTDVTLSTDVTGIVMTPGSVIIEDGVNVEGLIVSGDRIYLQGNNNIVSSVEVLRDIVKEELYQDIYLKEEYETDEERALNSVHLYMTDYLGGLMSRGFVKE